MVPILEQHRGEIESLCRKCGITRLEVFGSAVNGKFDPATSDVDFLYEIDDDAPNLPDRYFEFVESVERLLGRRVDMVYFPQVTNRFFKAQVNEERTLYYAA